MGECGNYKRKAALFLASYLKKIGIGHHQEQLSDCRTLKRDNFSSSGPHSLVVGKQRDSNVHQSPSKSLWRSPGSGSSTLITTNIDTQVQRFTRFTAQSSCRGTSTRGFFVSQTASNTTSPYMSSYPLFEVVHPAVTSHSGNLISRRTRGEKFTLDFTHIRDLLESKESKYK